MQMANARPNGWAPNPPQAVKKETMKDKLAILGCSERLLDAVEDILEDDSYEFWGLNNLMRGIPKSWIYADRWFDLHGYAHIVSSHYAGVLSPVLYCDATIPIVVHEEREEWPTSVRYPMEEICKYYDKPMEFWTSTAAMMFALALYEKRFREIAFVGFEMATDSEYASQRGAMYYLTAWAERDGVELAIPEGCLLYSTKGEPYFGLTCGKKIVEQPDPHVARVSRVMGRTLLI